MIGMQSIAQSPSKVKEKLTRVKDVSLEESNGFTQDSSFYLKPNNKENNRIPPKYPELRKEDVLFTETIWEDIDGRQKKNRHFLYESVDETGERNFFKILTSILESDTTNVKAYAPNNDRFTTQFKMDSVFSVSSTVKSSLSIISKFSIIFNSLYLVESPLFESSIFSPIF
jgi:hypothetical protein